MTSFMPTPLNLAAVDGPNQGACQPSLEAFRTSSDSRLHVLPASTTLPHSSDALPGSYPRSTSITKHSRKLSKNISSRTIRTLETHDDSSEVESLSPQQIAEVPRDDGEPKSVALHEYESRNVLRSSFRRSVIPSRVSSRQRLQLIGQRSYSTTALQPPKPRPTLGRAFGSVIVSSGDTDELSQMLPKRRLVSDNPLMALQRQPSRREPPNELSRTRRRLGVEMPTDADGLMKRKRRKQKKKKKVMDLECRWSLKLFRSVSVPGVPPLQQSL